MDRLKPANWLVGISYGIPSAFWTVRAIFVCQEGMSRNMARVGALGADRWNRVHKFFHVDLLTKA